MDGAHDRQRFARCLAMLAVTFNKTVSEAKADAYWEALSDIPIDLIELGARRLLKTAPHFPAPSKWRVAVDAEQDAHAEAQESSTRRLTGEVAVEDTTFCEECQDTGWRPSPVPTSHIYGPEYQRRHPTTSAVMRCACWDQNPKNVGRARRYATNVRDHGYES